MNTYVYYSGATDKTGSKIQEALKSTGGAKAPAEKVDIMIGWGTKIKEKTSYKTKATRVLNDPNAIRENRNKFKALQVMESKNVRVGTFTTAENVMAALKNGNISLPVIGRTNFHQGGKGFWACWMKTHVQEAIKSGAQYFQKYIPIVDEYRLHVFGDDVFYISKKVKDGNEEDAFIKGFAEKIKSTANKDGTKLDQTTLDYTLKNMANRKTNTNVLKSHDAGYVFKKIAEKNLKTKTIIAMSKDAVKAVRALGLDFGAVDCGIDEDGNTWVIEVNTGPGLEGKTFDAWIEQFEKAIKDIEDAAKAKPTTTKIIKQKTTAIKTATTKQLADNKKADAIRKARLLQELLENADENDIEAVMRASSKMFAHSGEAAAANKEFG